MMKGIVSIVLLGVTVNGCRFRGNSPGIQSVRGIARQAVGDVALHSHTIMKSGYEPEHSAEQFAAGCAEDIKKFNCPPVDTTKEGGIYTTFQCLRAFPITRSCMVAKRDWRLSQRQAEGTKTKLMASESVKWDSAAAALQMEHERANRRNGIRGHGSLENISKSPKRSGPWEIEVESESKNEMELEDENTMKRHHHPRGPRGPAGRHPHHPPHDPSRGPNGRRERPHSTFGVLTHWFSGNSEGEERRDSSDSSSSDSSSSESSDDSFPTKSYSHWRAQQHAHRPPPPHHHHHGGMMTSDMALSEGDLMIMEEITIPHTAHGAIREDSQHDRIGNRNHIPDDEFLLENDQGGKMLLTVLAFFFFVGASTLIIMPFLLFARALRRLVRGNRRARATPFSRRNGAVAGAPEGYEALPEDTDDDAIVVTGTPVNPPPSVNI